MKIPPPAVLVLLFFGMSAPSFAVPAFELKSKDVKDGDTLSNDYAYNGFGCSGKNLAPELHWANAPKGAKSFAVTVYDPDAPTGSGFWHWIAVNIPANRNSLGGTEAVGASVPNDYGVSGYGGPCPPPGKPHRYVFTVYALKTDKLDLPPGATNAVARFMIHGASIAKASFTVKYGR